MEIDYLTVGPVSWDTTIKFGLKDATLVQDIQFLKGGINSNPGGTALNNAAALKTQFERVAICGVTGNDPIGHAAKRTIEHRLIDTRYIRPDLPETSRSIIFINRDGTRIILNDPKSLEEYQYPVDQFRSILTDVRFAHFSIARFSQNLIPLAKERGIGISTDLQIVERLTPDHQIALSNADIVFLSGAKLQQTDEDVVKYIWSYGVRLAIITHDKNGVSVGNRDTQDFRIYPAIPSNLVADTTGAGDSFAAIFCASIAKGKNLEESVLKALIFSSNKIKYLGSINGMMSANELEDAYRELLNNPRLEESS